MGSDAAEGFAEDGEGPSREVSLSPYAIAATTVTNAEFAAFVRATGHVTDAERSGASFVFYLQLSKAARGAVRRVPSELPWWLPVEGACWLRPNGPGSGIDERLDHPVVHVSWHDAVAYCDWAACRLPSEAQWEHAARGGLHAQRFPWGDGPDGEAAPCNIWHGRFPNAPADGWPLGTVPAHSGAANGLGLYHCSGNVWEWCADWFSPRFHQETAVRDPLQAERGAGRRSMRGGSFLCHAEYCNRYRIAGRSANTPDTTTSHIGFRVAR